MEAFHGMSFPFVTIFLAFIQLLSHLSSSHLVRESGSAISRMRFLDEGSEVLDPFIRSTSI